MVCSASPRDPGPGDDAATREWQSHGKAPQRRRRIRPAAVFGLIAVIVLGVILGHPLTDWLARRHVGHLLKPGIRTFLCKDFMLHAKTTTIDGTWSVMGSINVDSLSLLGLNEGALEVYSGRFTQV